MTKKEEKEKQGNGSFSDSAEMFDTFFRVELNKEKQGDGQPSTDGKPLSDSEEMFVSAFKEAIQPEVGSPRIVERRPEQKAPQGPAKPPGPSAQAIPQAPPPRASPSPGTGKLIPPPQESKGTPPRVPRSGWQPFKVIVPVLGVVALAGVIVLYLGAPDFFSFREKPQPTAPPAKKEVRPPSPPPNPEVKGEPRPSLHEQATPEKPRSGEPEVSKEQPAVEVVAKTPDSAAPQKDVPLPKPPSLPYSIFLGSFKDLERLQKAVSSFREAGLSPYWFTMNLGEKGVWYRVFAGCFPTREEAEAFIQEKRIPDASSRHTPYAALAGTYRSQEELGPVISRLMKLGYGPYVIRQQDGSSHVYIGASYQKGQAEALVAELAERGIESRPAER